MRMKGRRFSRRAAAITIDVNEIESLPVATARSRRWWGSRWTLGVLLALLALLAWDEARTSRIQSLVATRLARALTFRFEPGPTDSVVYPTTGPYDIRRGYTAIPAFTDTLTSQHFEVTGQARLSPLMLKLARAGITPAYREKAQAGLTIFDDHNDLIYQATYPERLYASFEEIPGPVVRTLLYIENRELLSPGRPYRNPAVEWDRLARAGLDFAVQKLTGGQDIPGGSTLATQIEKYRHSAEGRTATPADKLKQMTAATLRAYLDGRDTGAARHDVVLNFVNSVPLAALAGYGEVNGLGDGLWAWYDADFARVNERLKAVDQGGAIDEETARAYRQVLSIFIAHRRPSAFLITDRGKLRRDTDAYLRLLARDRVIPEALRDRALALPLEFRHRPPVIESNSYVRHKAANAIRTRLLSLMNLEQLYDLDRVDMTASSTLDRTTQQAVTRTLLRLRESSFADSAGLRGERLLQRGDPAGIVYSFTLYEKTPRGNLLRVQADNYDQPLDINEGAKLDLGSTAKLRTLVNYLEIVTGLHRRYAGQARADLRKVHVDRQDAIRCWAMDWLGTAADTTLPAMLEAAMDRSYSASTSEKFFTSGGLLSFSNFEKEDNGQVMTVREATRRSVNLVYIRLMRDIVRYYTADIPGYDSEMYQSLRHPERRKYLEKFADKEGKQFLAKFIGKYREKSPDQCLDAVVAGIRPTPVRLAVIFRSVRPDAPFDEFRGWALRQMAGAPPSERTLRDVYDRYPKTAFDLADRGYIARLHPLDLWLAEYLYAHPGAGWKDVTEASVAERQTVYKWLFNSRSLEGQNSRIRILVEDEAFQSVHAAWKRQGYPFASLVPSYATSIGSSADRPAALAELMGIIVNEGMRYPTARIESVHLAAGTPWEIRYDREAVRGERVYPPELTRVVRGAIIDVVENGTARRLKGTFTDADGSVIPVGGKTGTGDHRFETYGKGGVLLESRVMNRTGTFVFLIGDRFFGTLVAYVAGPKAAGYGFTSALPVQIMKSLAPALQPLIDSAPAMATLGDLPREAGSNDPNRTPAGPALPSAAPARP